MRRASFFQYRPAGRDQPDTLYVSNAHIPMFRLQYSHCWSAIAFHSRSSIKYMLLPPCGRSNHLCPQRLLRSPGHFLLRPQINQRHTPQHQSGTMMEGSSSSATTIEHGSEDADPLIRPGVGGGVTSGLPVEIERLGKMYVVSFCCWGLC